MKKSKLLKKLSNTFIKMYSIKKMKNHLLAGYHLGKRDSKSYKPALKVESLLPKWYPLIVS